MGSIWDQQLPEKKKRAREIFVPINDPEEWAEIAHVIDGETKPLAGYEGRYSVSSSGYIFNGHGLRLRPNRRTNGKTKYGAVMVYLWDGSKSRREDLARLVYGTFRCAGGQMPITQGLVWLDGDTENCALSNLRVLGADDTPFS